MAATKKSVDLFRTLQKQEVRGLDSAGGDQSHAPFFF